MTNLIEDVEKYINLWRNKYKHSFWRIEWNNEPMEEDGFAVITSLPDGSTVQVAFCDTRLTALVVASALNEFCK